MKAELPSVLKKGARSCMPRKRGKDDAAILIIEDDHDERAALGRAFVKAQCPYSLHFAADGTEALTILSGVGPRGNLPVARIVLSDLHMPRMDGVEFLTKLRSSDVTKNTIVFIYSQAADPVLISRAYQLGISGFFPKELEGGAYYEFVSMLSRYMEFVIYP
jgi:CheY-like chemotaxis protein